ncbi:hypothetical protein KSS87_016934 [Heliosperma pusillum]|nr:hypothetical protein KSS87_016934 [Heliosperma pusillum]
MDDHGRPKPLLTPVVMRVCKRSREESHEFSQHITKFAAARASPAVVSIVTHHVPEEMCVNFQGYMKVMPPPPKDIIFFGCGMIVECQTSTSNRRKYLCKVLAPASLFQRPNHVNLNTIKIHVFGFTGILYKPKLLGCDFHYNLAVVAFKSKSPLPTVTFKDIDDVLSIHPTAQNPPFQFLPHSHLFKILPGTRLISVSRSFIPPYRLQAGSGFYRKFCRPFLGLEVANLHDADLDFLALFTTKYPNISAGVIVTKVEKGSPACCSGIQIKDVIVKLDGKQVKSKLKFFEAIWDKDEKSVEFNVLRVINGEELNRSLVIGEASPEKFHQWMHPGWIKIWNDAYFGGCK